MKKLSPNSVTMHEGRVVLTKRSRSSRWQMRYKFDGRWIRKSTNKSDLDEAKEAATDSYLEAKFKKRSGLPVVSKQFKAIAEIAKKRMQEEIDAGHGKVVYKDYVSAIDNYLTPFFGNHYVTSIDYPLLKQFAEWRTKKAGRELKGNTQNTHNCAMRRVFDVALELRYITQSQIPVLVTQGEASGRRPDFTEEEYVTLVQKMRPWSNLGRMQRSRWIRALLFEYVQILALTGMRHGTEAESLNWKTISLFDNNGRKFVEMYVNGKKGNRSLAAGISVLHNLKKLHAMAEDLKHLTFDEVLAQKPDKLVFRLPDGTVTKHLDQPFKAFLDEKDLLTCKRTGDDRTLYSLRHTFATLRMLHGATPHDLAKQMGTSVEMIEKYYGHLTPRMRADKTFRLPMNNRSPFESPIASGPGSLESDPIKVTTPTVGNLPLEVDGQGVVQVKR